MTYALIPNFSVPLAPISTDADRIPFHADPVLAAIDAHSEAWSVLQATRTGDRYLRAEEVMDAALDTLLGTACATRFGGFAMSRHLRWWLEVEAEHAAEYQPAYSIAQAREADLTLFLGSDGVSRLAPAMPSGRLPSPAPEASIERIVIDAGPVPSPAIARLARAVAAVGEHLAGLILIVGGGFLIGLSTRL